MTLAAAAVLVAGCAPSDSPTVVDISGSSTVQPITADLAEKFIDEDPDVAIRVDGPGTGDGFELFCDGATDISDASRPIRDAERAACRDNGVEFVELKVAIDGLSVLTHPANDAVDCLSFLDLYALLGPESAGFDDWSDANDLAAELTEQVAGRGEESEVGASHAPYPDAPLDVVGPGEESGTFDTFVELAIEHLAEIRGEDATTRPDYTSSPNDNVIVQGIVRSDTSLGWVGYAFFLENRDRLRALAVDGGDGCTEPTDETIATGEYPLSRPLFIYVNTDRAREASGVADFVDFYLSDAGRESVSRAGYVNLTDEAWEETRERWEDAR